MRTRGIRVAILPANSDGRAVGCFAKGANQVAGGRHQVALHAPARRMIFVSSATRPKAHSFSSCRHQRAIAEAAMRVMSLFHSRLARRAGDAQSGW